MEHHLGCKELSVFFEDETSRIQVLNQISLSISPGEKVLILGPSGSGKSTLLSVLSGIIPDHVEAEVSGEVYRNPACGVMFQDPDAQFCMLHVDEEIAFSLENRRLPRTDMDAVIQQVMNMVDLRIDPHTPIDTLSGGMKQRLALACLLALEPKVLFFDEPTAQLDPASRRDIFQLLHKVAQSGSQTMIFVEHVLDGCIEWMDRVILLNAQGRIIADGVPKQVVIHHRQQMEEAGIWLPRLFPDKWQEVVGNPSHPLAVQLQQDLLVRQAADSERLRKRSTEAPIILRTDHLYIGYRKRTVVEDISLSFQPGEWIAVTGQNGSGKSTFLKSLLRLEPMLSGRIFFQGRELRKWADRELYTQAGFVFQNPELQFVTDTVYDEVAFGGRQRGWPEAQVEEKTLQLLHEFGLEAYRSQHPFTLSLGQKRRLSVATMLLFDQKMLLLDEPTFGQDARTAAELIRRLKQRQEQGTTIVMVTHDMDLVDAHADRVILFQKGRAVYNGTPYHLFNNSELLQDSSIIPPLHYRLQLGREERNII